jgi:hypothetical protein
MAPTFNMTIAVPNGTTNHGDVGRLCPTMKWDEIVFFYAIDYFAHAFTVKHFPREQLSSYVKAITFAVLYPYSGILRGLDSLLRCAYYTPGDNLQKAAVAGALCVVTRSANWIPEDGEIPRGIKLPDRPDGTMPTDISWRVELPSYFQEAGLSGPIL